MDTETIETFDDGAEESSIGHKLALAAGDPNPATKLELLNCVISELINDESAVWDNFQDEICQFCQDSSPNVRASVLRFIHHALKMDRESLPLLSGSLIQLVSDEHHAVTNVTLAHLIKIVQLYKPPKYTKTTYHISVKEMLLSTLAAVQRIFDDENDGMRTQAVRTVEAFVGMNAPDLKVIANSAFESLNEFLKKATISNGNMVAGLVSLSRLAKSNAKLMMPVITQYEFIHANLPPTLSVTQVQNVRKIMRIQLMDIVRTSSNASSCLTNISQLLFDLGVSKSEFEKALSQLGSGSAGSVKADKRKRKEDAKAGKATDDQNPSKKPRNDVEKEKDKIEELAEQILPQLTVENVTTLVINSMKMLPDTIPASFSATYTPIDSAGTDPQKKHLARLLANQMVLAGLGQKSDDFAAKKVEKRPRSSSRNPDSSANRRVAKSIPSIKADPDGLDRSQQSAKLAEKRKRQRQEFNLESVTQELSRDGKFEMVKMAAKHILTASNKHSQNQTRHLMLTKIVAQFGGSLPYIIADLIEQQPKSRLDLALSWLYAEYSQYIDIRMGPDDIHALENYNTCITILLTLLKEKRADSLFNQLLLQAPVLTEETFRMITNFCIDGDEEHAQSLLKTVGKLCIQRPTNRVRLISILLDLADHHVLVIRVAALDQVVSVYSLLKQSRTINTIVSQYISKYLSYLVYEAPPEELSEFSQTWPEDLIERCLALSLAVLPQNASVLRDLATIFCSARSEVVKRTIMRAVDAPVRQLDQSNLALLDLVRNCPPYCETFVTRILHTLTDKKGVEPQLIDAIRDLMKGERRDIRFVIPVLGALTKNEVIDALPELITLHRAVVKDVFYRLLGVQRGDISGGVQVVAPLTAVELLIELHKMDGGSVKNSIDAISLCLAEKQVFTLEVFASAIDRMLALERLPTLFMRTVLQALITHPRMTSQIINTLIKLIPRKIWEQNKIWDGYVMCCQKLKARCVGVLLQLPEEPLARLIQSAPDTRSYLAAHLDTIDVTKRSKLDGYFTKIAMLPQAAT